MKELDLNDPEQREHIKEILKQGAKSEFWQVITQRLQEHIDSVQSLLDSEALPVNAEEYKIRVETLKNQKRDRQGIIDMPEVLTHELDSPDFFRKEEDEIYSEPEDFEK